MFEQLFDIFGLRPAPRRAQLLGALGLVALAGALTGEAFAQPSEFAGLIRTKRPDRGSYDAPTLPATSSPGPAHPASARDLSSDALGELPWPQSDGDHSEVSGNVVPTSYNPGPAHPYATTYEVPFGSGMPGAGMQGAGVPGFGMSDGGLYAADAACGAEVFGGCDGGCDSFCGGCANCGGYPGLPGIGGMRVCGDPCQWFGSIELMLMFRSGDRLPILATTSATGQGDGTLPIGPPGDTRVLFGGESVLRDMTAGGRFTIGTWLDDYHCRSLYFAAGPRVTKPSGLTPTATAMR